MDKEIVSANIKALRERNGMTQEEFASRLNISRPIVSYWESGKSIPTSEQLVLISDIFSESVDCILGIRITKENWVIPDTSALLRRPRIIEDLVKRYDRVLFSEVVISELNGIKDHNKRVKQSAWLVLKTISQYKNSDKVSKCIDNSKKTLNDDRIIDLAFETAKANPNTLITLLSDDIYFSVQTRSSPNVNFISVKEYEDERYVDKEEYDIITTQKFFSFVRKGKIEEAKKIQKRADINRIDPDSGFTPLIQAVRNRDKETLTYLTKLKRMNLNKVDSSKYELPPISHALQMKDLEIMNILIDAGCDIDCGSTGKNSGNTPLMIAAWHGMDAAVEKLVMEGACCNQQDNNGFTPLIKACIKKHPSVIEQLVGITDLKIRSKEGKVAIDYVRGNRQFTNLFTKFTSGGLE